MARDLQSKYLSYKICRCRHFRMYVFEAYRKILFLRGHHRESIGVNPFALSTGGIKLRNRLIVKEERQSGVNPSALLTGGIQLRSRLIVTKEGRNGSHPTKQNSLRNVVSTQLTSAVQLVAHNLRPRKHNFKSDDKKEILKRKAISGPKVSKTELKKHQRSDFQLMALVFAKVKGYSPWPAIVESRRDNKYVVRFFGTGEISEVKAIDMHIYCDVTRECFGIVRSKYATFFRKALIEISEAHIKQA